MTNNEEIAEEFKKTKFFKDGSSCFECFDYETMYEELIDFIISALQKKDEEWKEKVWNYIFSSFPKDMENLSIITEKQAYHLLKSFIKKLENN